MATGDLIAASILGTSPHNGWTLSVTIEGWAAATGLAVVSGWTDPNGVKGNILGSDTPKGTVNLTSQGYTESGGTFTLGTLARALYVTRAVQKAYPNQADINATVSGSDLVVYVAINDWVYSDDSAVTLTALAGMFTSNLGSSAAVSGLSVTNSSTKAYPTVKAAWVDPVMGRIGSTYSKRISAAHPYGLAGCQFTITDQSAHTVTNTVTTQSSHASTRYPTLPRITAYQSTASTSTLTDGDGITVVAKIYPTVGNASSIFDSTAETAAHRKSRFHRLDRAGTYRKPFAYVDGTGAGTPTVSTTAATARANPYSSIWTAVAALAAYTLANYSETDSVEGCHIRLMDNAGADRNFTFGRSGFDVTRTAAYAGLTIEPDPLNTGDAVLVGVAAAQQNLLVANLRFSGLRIEPTAGNQVNYFIAMGGTEHYVFESCDFTQAGTSTGVWIDTDVNVPESYECSFTNFYAFLPTNHTVWPTVTGKEQTGMVDAGNCLMGWRSNAFTTNYQSTSEARLVINTSAASNGYIAFFEATTLDSEVYSVGQSLTNFYLGHGTMRRHSTGGAASPLLETSSQDITNCLFEHLSGINQRWNVQVPTAGSTKVFDRIYSRSCAFAYIAPKADVFATDGTVTGAWEVMYGVGWEGTYNGRGNTFPFYFAGLNSFEYRTGTDTTHAVVAADSDATPTAASEVLKLVPTGRTTSRYDMTGRRLSTHATYTAASGSLQPAGTTRFTVGASTYTDGQTATVTAGSISTGIDLSNYTTGAAMEVSTAGVSGDLSGLSGGTGVTQGTTSVTATMTGAAGTGVLTITDTSGTSYTLNFTINAAATGNRGGRGRYRLRRRW